MIKNGFGHIVNQVIVDTHKLRASLSKKAIARYLEDSVMLQQAIEAQRKALGAASAAGQVASGRCVVHCERGEGRVGRCVER